MTDRELLEAAAKAAGKENHSWCEFWQAMALKTPDGFEGKSWNPLVDDGDALRLAVKLRIDVMSWAKVDGEFGDHAQAHHIFSDATAMEDFGTDRYAATRRAIVRAAAAMAQE